MNPVATVSCAIVLLAVGDVPKKDHEAPQDVAPRQDDPVFLHTTDTSGRFLALLRIGDDANRRAYVTVFEDLGNGNLLRKLYETELLNKEEPLVHALSRDGRFFVTLDEFSASGTGPLTVVIYDLARKEHTAYAGKDFLSKTIKRSLLKRGGVPGFWWYGTDMEFNRDSTEFYPTRPENCERKQVPFVVVHLPTRTVRVQPIDSVDPRNIVPYNPKKWGWYESRETVRTETTVLPVRMTWSCAGFPDRVLELAPNKADYVPVKGSKQDEQE